MAQFQLIKHEFPIIFAAIKFDIVWSNALRVSAPTTTILTTTAHTFNGLNCFGHVIHAPQTSNFENMAKLLTHPSTFKDI